MAKSKITTTHNKTAKAQQQPAATLDPALLPASLLAWFSDNARILPWREDPTPYHVWLSEIMLQQTRVETVTNYYHRFLAALPDVGALAAAEEDVYLKLWEGLGYYSRVRNLHKAAVIVAGEEAADGGTIADDKSATDGSAASGTPNPLPTTYKEWLALPGVGEYTAAAITSICYGEKRPAVDGNLLRIFARMTGYEKDILTGAAKKEAAGWYGELMEVLPEAWPPDRAAEEDRRQAVMEKSTTAGEEDRRQVVMEKSTAAGAFNQALMDLGATVCVGNGAPRCEACPWRDACRAHAAGREQELPVRIGKTKKKEEQLTVFLIHYRGKIILRKRPARGLLAGLYEFPNAPGHLSQKKAAAFLKEMGVGIVRIQKLPEAKHIFTHKIWQMTGYEVFADEWPGFEEQKPTLFLADPTELTDTWAVPSAFSDYKKYLIR